MLNGANIMCQGLTSPGGRIEDALKGETVVLNAEGKEHAMAVGVLEKDSNAIKTDNSGIAIESLNFMGDDLWRMKDIKK